MYDKDGFPIEFTAISSPDDEMVADVVPTTDEDLPSRPTLRQQFPPSGEWFGGTSDGWEYRTFFSGRELEKVFEMVRQFLKEEGFGDVPLPANAAELRFFKRPRPGQLQLFGEFGYCHNPIKILFPSGKDRRKGLILCIYNENAPHHLLRFHGLLPNASE